MAGDPKAFAAGHNGAGGAPVYHDPDEAANAPGRIIEGGGKNSVISGRTPKSAAPESEEQAPFVQKKSRAVYGVVRDNLRIMKDHASAIDGAISRSRPNVAANVKAFGPETKPAAPVKYQEATAENPVESRGPNRVKGTDSGRIAAAGGSELQASQAEKDHGKAKGLLESAQTNLDIANDHFGARNPARAGKYVLLAAKALHRARKFHSTDAVRDVTGGDHPLSEGHVNDMLSQAEGMPKFKEERKASGVVQLGDTTTADGMGGRYEATPELLRRARKIAGRDAPVTKKIEAAVKPTRRIAKPDRDKELKIDSNGREINKSRTLGGRDINPEKKADNKTDIVGRAGSANMDAYVPEKASTANPSRPKLGAVVRRPKPTRRAATDAPVTPRTEGTSVFPDKPAKPTYPSKVKEVNMEMRRKGGKK